MKDFRELEIWRLAHAFVLEIYVDTRAFPRDEVYGLASQLRRAAMSIPSNIAEGCGRSGDAELVRFCRIAMGSASEADYQLQLAHELGYLSRPRYTLMIERLTQIRKMLSGFIRSIKPKN